MFIQHSNHWRTGLFKCRKGNICLLGLDLWKVVCTFQFKHIHIRTNTIQAALSYMENDPEGLVSNAQNNFIEGSSCSDGSHYKPETTHARTHVLCTEEQRGPAALCFSHTKHLTDPEPLHSSCGGGLCPPAWPPSPAGPRPRTSPSTGRRTGCAQPL